MATKVGVGFSENPTSLDAGREAARAAMTEAGVSKCDLAIMYSTSLHDPANLRDGVRSVIGPTARLIGGYSIGIITRDKLGYDGCQVGVAVMSSESIKVDMFIEKDLTDNEYNVGLALGNQIKNKKYTDTPNILLMYDFVKGEPSESLYWNKNWTTPLIEGMGQSLGTWPPAAGFGMLGDRQGKPTYQWFDQRIEQQAAMALVFSGGVRLDTIIMHGCRPSSGYHTITKAKDNIVLEIDGKPAADMMAELLGPESYKNWIECPYFGTIGVNKGDKFSQFKEENYAIRVVAGVDQERGGLIIVEPDLKVGTEIQLMRRSIDFEDIGERAKSLLKRVKDENRKPFFALYIDCGGRTSLYCGTEGEEAEEIQKVIGSKMPLLGPYSGSEIAKVGGDMQVMGWTGVLCLFSE